MEDLNFMTNLKKNIINDRCHKRMRNELKNGIMNNYSKNPTGYKYIREVDNGYTIYIRKCGQVVLNTSRAKLADAIECRDKYIKSGITPKTITHIGYQKKAIMDLNYMKTKQYSKTIEKTYNPFEVNINISIN